MTDLSEEAYDAAKEINDLIERRDNEALTKRVILLENLVASLQRENLLKIDLAIARRALFLSCRWTAEGTPQSKASIERGMAHFIGLANDELLAEEKG